ncbi:MAG: Hsp20/alpha crystallin family protein [Deltaproteobacteria bacterium]|nr:MAG: Hsp20/alpha crystallin family protein [Deltaproteobacteria bacterium]RLC18356.1 MAG: Hsp20/alpha crystallin family protein [Deltaproteobacteria bacterium]RLD92860.1 MAG: Hsp20/alpha crystallin family protein [Bacteroidota bacterium]
MTKAEAKELKVREKQEVPTDTEQTRPGPVYTPDVDIFESETDITLLADMPGVTTEHMTIDLCDDVLTVTGETETDGEASEEPIVMEYGVGKYYRQFTLSEVIDQAKITAELKDGVLRLVLPKVQKATPRKITVSTG